MAARHTIPAHADHSRPPLFSPAEWQWIVQTLSLSPRQAEVVGLTMQSKKDKEIAKTLGIEETTVYTHIKIAKSRLNAVDRVGLAYRVFECFRSHVKEAHPHK
jgi:DNA-binding CsgD family transcriptional regulator